ncbi:MAG: prolyl oligopeptidase family serine peptidase, partial [Smithellaceae bacterium]|nr:prolyl oligopeptidase family serine peptidase [Smithellaceae bacterium]
DADGELLMRHLEDVCSRVPIDRSRVLLTGMSDGGTFALDLGLTRQGIFSKIAAVSCALPPVKINRAEEKHVLWVHGAQDWIFPVERTVQACRVLQQSGVDIKLKVVPDLSHAYPREENDTILKWFGIEG